MIKKQVRLVITFSTTTEAMAMEKMCKTKGLDGRLIPVPKIITAGCGLAWSSQPENKDELTEHMLNHSIQPEGMYECLV